MQTRLARFGQIAGYGVLSGVVAGGVTVLAALVLAGPLNPGTVANALGWGGIVLAFISGAIAYSQVHLGGAEAQMRGRLGQRYRLPALPLDQILTTALGAALLFLAQVVIWPR
ncbi:hypothetical protein [Deinococcus rufus]|uniref:Uncharacterized protein n=1 Tax=Deinococcus rufus TaxID=2136097 RepID=A0ABV7ZBB5_9DEIO